MKVAVGGVFHETNTFSSMRTSWQEFESHALARGMDIIDIYEGTSGTMGGVIDAAREYGLELVPTIYAGAVPGGLVDDGVFKQLVDELCKGLGADIDGVLLVLHGAMVTDKQDDAEAYLLQKVAETIGSHIPVVCTTDLHANISPVMVAFSRCLVGFDTYPHHDYYQRAYDAVNILNKLMRKEIHPVSVLKKPLLMPVVQKMLTDQYPMQKIMELVHEVEGRQEVINVTFAGGFPYADIKWAGMSVVVTTDGNLHLAKKYAEEIEQQLWSMRHDFIFQNNSVSAGVKVARESTAYPFVIVDSSDNVGGGSSADGTEVLAELLKQKLESGAVIIRDLAAVEKAEKAGVGQIFEGCVGGKTDDKHGNPVPVKGLVKSVHSGVYHSERTGERINMGRTVVVDINGLSLILTRDRVPAFDLETLRCVGINPEELKYIVVKGAIQWKSSYGKIAKGWVEVDAPGVTSSNLSRFSFKKIRRPIFPLDDI